MGTYHYSVMHVPNRDVVQALEEAEHFGLRSIAAVGDAKGSSAFLLQSEELKDAEGTEATEAFELRCGFLGWTLHNTAFFGSSQVKFGEVARSIAEQAARLAIASL